MLLHQQGEVGKTKQRSAESEDTKDWFRTSLVLLLDRGMW